MEGFIKIKNLVKKSHRLFKSSSGGFEVVDTASDRKCQEYGY